MHAPGHIGNIVIYIYIFFRMIQVIQGFQYQHRLLSSPFSFSRLFGTPPPYLHNINDVTKRHHRDFILISISTGFIFGTRTKRANAARGAFEMDADFYLQNMFGKRSKPGTNRVVFPSPRVLDSHFSTELYKTIVQKLSSSMKVSASELENKISKLLPLYISEFKTAVPIVSENLTDQYYFDIVLLIAYRLAGEVIVTSEARVQLRNLVGDAICRLLVAEKYISQEEITSSEKASSVILAGSKIINILDVFQRNGIIKGYKFDSEDINDFDFIHSSFEQGLPISFQITLMSPITLLGFIKQSENNTFYHPEIIASTISSFMRSLKLNCRFEDYLLDNYYREENFDIQAQDVLVEFIISTK